MFKQKPATCPTSDPHPPPLCHIQMMLKTSATLRWYSKVPTQEVMFWVLWTVAGSESAKAPDLLVCLRGCLVFNWACMCWSHINQSHSTDWTSNTTCSNHLHFNSTKHGSQQSKLCPRPLGPKLAGLTSPCSLGFWKCGTTLCTHWLLATMKHKRRLLNYALTLFWREKNYITFFTTIKSKSKSKLQLNLLMWPASDSTWWNRL